VAYVFYASAGIVAGLSLLLSSDVKHSGGIALVVFCVVVWLAVQYLGYEELDAARHMIFGGIFRRTLNANLSISQLEMALRVAPTVDECWGALVETSRGFGFSEASLEFLDLRLTCAGPSTNYSKRVEYYGSIPSFDGVWADAACLEDCRDELEEVVQEWLLFRLSRQLPVPILEGIDLVVREVA
jgi:predicted RNase H-like HicB family nuclease